MSDHETQLARWRLILGSGAEDALGQSGRDGWGDMDTALGFLYDREYDRDSGRNVRQRQRSGGQGGSSLTVPEWINLVHELFPQRTIERLERDALERYQLQDIVTNPEVLERAQPNPALLQAVLRTKHLMDQRVLALARQMVRQVIEELLRKLSRDIRSPFAGAVNRLQRSQLKIARNFDLDRTLKTNLKHYDPARRQVLIQNPQFFLASPPPQ